MEKINFFNRLENLLFQLDSHLEAVSLPCGSCIDCCVDLKDSSIFTPLYIDYINHNLSVTPDNTYPLLSWEEGLELSLCPYLDVINSRCNIYKFRPCTCRIYPVLLFKNPELLYNECAFTSYDFASLRNSDLYDKIDFIVNQISELNLNYLLTYDDKFRIEKYKHAYCNRLSLSEKANRDIKLYTSAVLLNEKSSSLHYCLARSYVDIKENELALKEVDKIINLYENNIKARLLRASLYNSIKRTDEAIFELKKVMELSPLNTQSYYMLAIIYLSLENYGEAYRLFKEVTKINPLAHQIYPDLEVMEKLFPEEFRKPVL